MGADLLQFWGAGCAGLLLGRDLLRLADLCLLFHDRTTVFATVAALLRFAGGFTFFATHEE
jgi:hypothetical protein